MSYGIICPHCGHDHVDDVAMFFVEDEVVETYCDSCGRAFTTEAAVIWEFECKALEAAQ